MKRYLPALVFLLLACAANAQTNNLSDAEIKGQQLAQRILQEGPVTNFTQKGILTIRNSKGVSINIPVLFETDISNEAWATLYRATITNDNETSFDVVIVHRPGLPNQYKLRKRENTQTQIHVSLIPETILDSSQLPTPFAGSDFWICDLGLEFFHWPVQKVLRHENRLTGGCTVLESANPDPSTGYSRVDTWIDDDSMGILRAEAYDAKGKLLKEFNPKKIKKVNGQWELEDMLIRNIQTGSRTWIKFDLSHSS